MSILLCYELRNYLICCQLCTNCPGQRILDTLQGSLRFPHCLFGDCSLLGVEFVELLNSHLIFIIPISLLGSGLEGLDLMNSLITVFIYLIYGLNHAIQISPLHTKFFF